MKLLKKAVELHYGNQPTKTHTKKDLYIAVALLSVLIPIVLIVLWVVFQIAAPHLANTTYTLAKSPDLVLVFLVALGVTIIVKNI